MKDFKDYLRSLLLLCFILKGVACHADSEPQEESRFFLIHNNAAEAGMFAVFSSVLGALKFYEEGHHAGIKINLEKDIYVDPEVGPNWWEYFFEPIHIGDESAPHHSFTFDETMFLCGLGFNMPRKEANNLIQKYVRLKLHIQEKVNAYINKNFQENFVIGLHYRGTDKVIEVPLLAYEKVLNSLIDTFYQLSSINKKFVKVYVATDDQNFINFLKDRLPSRMVYNDFIRSSDNNPIHYNHTHGHSSCDQYLNNYQKGEEALLDCLILSKCNILIRANHSSLSYISAAFNPDMPVISLD